MNFGEAIRSVFSQYVGFSGRARRSEFWFWFLFNVIVGVVIAIIDAVIGTIVLAIIVDLVLLLPSIAVGIRRLHDTGRVGWWLLIGLIPLVGAIVLIVFYCQDSEPGANQYGPSPKQALAGGAYGGYPPPQNYPPQNYPPQG